MEFDSGTILSFGVRLWTMKQKLPTLCAHIHLQSVNPHLPLGRAASVEKETEQTIRSMTLHQNGGDLMKDY